MSKIEITHKYALQQYDLDAHEFIVRLVRFGDVASGVELQMPAWIPGSYMIRDFARHVTQISAKDDIGCVSLTKLDKQTWRTGPIHGSLVVDYRVYAFDLSVRAAFLDRSRAYFNGTSLFLRVAGESDAGWELHIARPASEVAREWRLATTLPGRQIDADGFGDYAGAGYDQLVDCPVEMGAFQRLAFWVDDVPHEMAVTDGGRFDPIRLSEDLQRVCSEHVAMFGELPCDRYLFQVLAVAEGYGGLEHCDSTSLICKRSDLPAVALERPDKGYRQFLALCSHEYFHLWNVKRIRPAALMASDLGSESYTCLLWAFEGITSYYDELALMRAGVLKAEEYLDLFATTVSRVLRTPGRHRQSVAESSFDAWTKFYKQDENAPNAIVSYYAKGALVAFGLDMELRRQSAGVVSLDDLMRRLWDRYGRTGEGVPERGLEAEVAALLAHSLDSFFADFVYGTAELPLAEWFGQVGVGLRVRPAASSDDLGGCRVDPPVNDLPPALGARYDAQPVGLRITQVLAGSAAQAAGLSAGDLLIAVDGERVSPSNLPDVLRRAEGESVEIHFFRRDRLTRASMPLMPPAHDTCDLWLIPDDQLAADASSRRAAWMQPNRCK